MNSGENPSHSDLNRAKTGRGRLLVVLLATLIGIEALLVWAGAIYFFTQMFMQEVNNPAGAILIFAITVVIAIGLVIVTVSTFRNKGWIRGAIVTWQILQFAVATSFIQGISQWQPLGWALVLMSAGALILVFVPSRENIRFHAD